MQIALTDLELGPDGSFVDPKKTQFGIIQKIAASVSTLLRACSSKAHRRQASGVEAVLPATADIG